MYTLIFKIEGSGDVKVFADAGANVLELMQNASISVDAPCSGNGTCGKCRIKLISGAVETQKNPHLNDEDFNDGWRLSCQSTVCADASFWVPAEASAFKSGIQTADLSSPEELARYEKAIDAIFSSGISAHVSESGVGVAIDIGTTTVTAAMLELESGKVIAKASLGNGQIKYGADVINRIIAQSKEGGVEKLRAAVLTDTVIPMVNTLIETGGRSDISRYVIAGNTTMEHLFLGIDAQSIRLEPYVPAFLEREGDTADSCGLPGNPDARVIFAPNVGSYVGGDITAGVLSSLLWNNDEMTLFIDLGTNGEIVFGNSDYMLCCACSAGPAFEGGDISCGMRATGGAIDTFESEDGTFEPHYTVIGDKKPLGLCGSGLISIVSELFRTGAINAKGKFVGKSPRIRYDEDDMGSYCFAYRHESGTGHEIAINESDLDNFIRAKGAIFSAIRTMLTSLDMSVDFIDKIIIAGGIGSGIDIKKSISIGMLPNIPPEKYSYIGNSSLTGACAMLLSDEAVQKVFDIGRNMTYIELSTEPKYMDELIAACFLPHTDSTLF